MLTLWQNVGLCMMISGASVTLFAGFQEMLSHWDAERQNKEHYKPPMSFEKLYEAVYEGGIPRSEEENSKGMKKNV